MHSDVSSSLKLPEQGLIGRTRELEELVRSLTLDTSQDKPAPILIRGPEGIGRKSLLAAAWAKLAERRVDALLFHCPSLQTSTPREIATTLCSEGLFGSGHNCRDFIREFTRREDVRQEHDHSAKPLANAPEEVLAWLTRLADGLVERDGKVVPAFMHSRFFVAFTDLDRREASLQRWLADQLLTKLSEALGPNLQPRVIVTACQSLEKKRPSGDYWDLAPRAVEIPLGPLDASEIADWLTRQSLPVDLAPTIVEVSGGIPGRIDEALRAALRRRNLPKLLERAEELLAKRSDGQIEILTRAAYLTEITVDALSIFSSRAEASRAHAWLCTLPQVSARDDDALALREKDAEALQAWLEETYSDKHLQNLALAEKFLRACRAIPSRDHRRMLCQLAELRHFSEKLIAEVYPRRMRSLWNFVHRNPRYFVKSGENLSLAPEYREAIQPYLDVLDSEDRQDVKQLAHNAWLREQARLRQEQAKLDAQAKQRHGAIEVVRQEMKALDAKLSQSRKRIQRLHQKQKRREQQRSTPQHSNVMPTILQAGGVGGFLTGLFVASDYATVFIMGGLGCLLAGVIMGVRAHRPAMGPLDGLTERITREEKNRQLLELKRSNLERRLCTLGEEVVHLRKLEQSTANLLEQAYI